MLEEQRKIDAMLEKYKTDDRSATVKASNQNQTNVNAAGAAGGELTDTWTTQTHLGRTNETWTTTHGFFAIMGGFHVYNHGKAVRPLDWYEVFQLVADGALVPPTLDELKDRSKGDVISKGVAILQTLWFVMQFIARCIEHLLITSLKVMTLAYTVITLAMYTTWWYKPLNIACHVRVPAISALILKRFLDN